MPAYMYLRACFDAQDNKIASLEDRASSLTSSLDTYKALRDRFISTFKRDRLANATDADRRRRCPLLNVRPIYVLECTDDQ